jgi:hypothetical protein
MPLGRGRQLMRSLILLCAVIALATLAVGATARTPAAQTNQGTYEACRSDRATIPAARLPGTVRLANCPVGERVITDHGIGTVLPAPGEGIYVDSLTTEGSQELQVTRYTDGTVELKYVGDESQSEPEIGTASSPGECSDGAYNDLNRKVKGDLLWYFNPRTLPDELSRKGAVGAIRKGTANILNTRNNCRLGDRVPSFVSMAYNGSTGDRAQVGTGGGCTGNDGKTVVSFGRLPKSALAVTCTIVAIEDGYDRVKWSDIMINKTNYNWTTRPDARSCRGKYDLAGTVTHERGHTFGLGHVSESSHAKLTMSDRSNGTCQSSERTLGLGDVRGLGNKY